MIMSVKAAYFTFFRLGVIMTFKDYWTDLRMEFRSKCVL
jgi:hypothetical protein